MAEGGEGYQPEQVIPLELAGLEDASNSESWGGNAGLDRGVVNVLYRDGAFIFADSPLYNYRSPAVQFRLRSIPYELERALDEKHIPHPPVLIDNVTLEPGVEGKEEFFIQRALQHNAFKIVGYLQRGGNPAYLPKTPLMPDIQQLRQSLQQK